MAFKTSLVYCATLLCAGFFILDFFRQYTRYEFLVTGDTCIALDRKENVIKVIGDSGCVVVPLTETTEEKIRKKIAEEINAKLSLEREERMEEETRDTRETRRG
jgi:hypothetical protein